MTTLYIGGIQKIMFERTIRQMNKVSYGDLGPYQVPLLSKKNNMKIQIHPAWYHWFKLLLLLLLLVVQWYVEYFLGIH